jgi:hypothetical protein
MVSYLAKPTAGLYEATDTQPRCSAVRRAPTPTGWSKSFLSYLERSLPVVRRYLPSSPGTPTLEAKDIIMTPEQTIIASAVNSWKLNVERADKVFSGLTDDQLQREVAPGRNRLVYLWGHLTAVHDAMLPLLGLGERLHPELAAAFLTAADRAVDGLPPAAELQRHWGEVNGRLLAGFDHFTASDWAGKHTAVSDEDFAVNPLRNRMSVLLSRTSHLAYHIGQSVLAPK